MGKKLAQNLYPENCLRYESLDYRVWLEPLGIASFFLAIHMVDLISLRALFTSHLNLLTCLSFMRMLTPGKPVSPSYMLVS